MWYTEIRKWYFIEFLLCSYGDDVQAGICMSWIVATIKTCSVAIASLLVLVAYITSYILQSGVLAIFQVMKSVSHLKLPSKYMIILTGTMLRSLATIVFHILVSQIVVGL